MKSSSAHNNEHAEQSDATISSAAISFKRLTFFYPEQEQPALDGVNLEVMRGEFLAVLGANGSGKSTLAKHMNALLIPTSGAAFVCGLDTSDARNALAIRQQCGMVFQNPDNQSVASIVQDDVAFGPENLGLAPAQIQERVRKALKSVGMLEYAEHELAFLSGGQKQRVAIAGALAMHPQVLVLDEPSSMLDVHGREQLLSLLDELHAQGTAIVLITHDVNEALHAERIAVMDQGRLALIGERDEVLEQSELLSTLGLELPHHLELQRRLRGERAESGAEDDSKLNAMGAQQGALAVVEAEAGRSKATTNEDAADRAAEDRGADKGNDANNGTLTLCLDGVGYSYADAHGNAGSDGAADGWALSDVSLRLAAGSILGIIGPTGSGKSTLLQIMAGLIAPELGGVHLAQGEAAKGPCVQGVCGEADRFFAFGGSDAEPGAGDNLGTRKHSFKRARRGGSREGAYLSVVADIRYLTGIAFQHPEQQLFASNVIDDVAFGPLNRGFKKTQARAIAAEALLRCGLDPEEFGDRSPYQLSGGQQRRVALAGVLALKPRFLLLDEPCAGLGPKARAEFFELIGSLKAQGLGIALVTHFMEDAAQHCDTLVVLADGKLQLHGTPREVFSPQNANLLKGINLDLPWPARYALEHELVGSPLTMDELVDVMRGTERATSQKSC